jgi:hypothetical protein
LLFEKQSNLEHPEKSEIEASVRRVCRNSRFCKLTDIQEKFGQTGNPRIEGTALPAQLENWQNL